MTQQFSVQYSTMQISFIHIMLNIHIFFFFWKQNIITESTNSRGNKSKQNRVLFALTFVQIETLNHAPTTPTHTNKFMCLMEKTIRRSIVCSGLA